MKRAQWTPVLLLLVLLGLSNCTSQEQVPDRKPAVAGQFYPGDPRELRQTLASLLAQGVPRTGGKDVLAIIAPHAGYVFSGGVAASAFNQVDPDREYDNVFILGPSHHLGFEGASVYPGGNYVTPLGPVAVNSQTARELLEHEHLFSSRVDAHAREHSIEVQVPFLQQILKKKFTIVPIVLGASSPETCERIAEVLRPYLNPKNLFVISTDFSHYPSYDNARDVDHVTAEAILSNSPRELLRALDRNATLGIPGLATSMCGWPAVLTLLDMTTNDSDITLDSIQYKNSGDAGIAGKEQVVGYWAITVSTVAEKTQGGTGEEEAGEQTPEAEKGAFRLEPMEKKALLKIARATVTEHVANRPAPAVDAASLTEALRTPCGCFVTLEKHDQLRGCIGCFGADEPLYKVVQRMAAAAATEDPRFTPVRPSEVNDLSIEISVLTPMRRVPSADAVQLGRHGVYIRKGGRSGTFLPQVATETGWNKEEFLGHLARDKAGIGWDGWKDAELFVYEALIISEHEFPSK